MLKPFLLALSLLSPCFSFASETLHEALEEYMDFADYSAGVISAKQLKEVGPQSFYIIDSRKAEQYENGRILGAVHIEWRQILARKDELPDDRPLLVYCDTGVLSSRAQFALSLIGLENVRVLLGGYHAWLANQ